MAKVEVEIEIEEVTLENEDGIEVDGVRATCTACDHTTESSGTSGRSRRRSRTRSRQSWRPTTQGVSVDESAGS
jgi:hypothetical protein